MRTSLGKLVSPLLLLLFSAFGISSGCFAALGVAPAGASSTDPPGLTYTVSIGSAEITGCVAACASATTLEVSALGGYPVTKIGPGAFSGNTVLQSVSFPNVDAIGTQAFLGATALTSASFPNANTILNSAFNGDVALTAFTFASTITSIGDEAFFQASSLNQLVFLGDAPSFPDSDAWTGVMATTVYYFSDMAGWSPWPTAAMGSLTGTPIPGPRYISGASISGDAVVGSVLTAHPGSWSSFAPTQTGFVWLSCTHPVSGDPVGEPSGCTEIPGATASTFTLRSQQIGNYISVLIAVTNGHLSATTETLRTTQSPVTPVPTTLPTAQAVGTVPTTTLAATGSNLFLSTALLLGLLGLGGIAMGRGHHGLRASTPTILQIRGSKE